MFLRHHNLHYNVYYIIVWLNFAFRSFPVHQLWQQSIRYALVFMLVRAIMENLRAYFPYTWTSRVNLDGNMFIWNLLRLVLMPRPQVKYFPVQPSHQANKFIPCSIQNIKGSLRLFSLDVKWYSFNLCCLSLVSECYKAQVLVSFARSSLEFCSDYKVVLNNI